MIFPPKMVLLIFLLEPKTIFFLSLFLLFLSLLPIFPFFVPFSFFLLRLVIIFSPNPSKAHIFVNRRIDTLPSSGGGG